MPVTSYDDLSCNFAKVVYSAYKNKGITLATLDLALTRGKITQDDYDFIKLQV